MTKENLKARISQQIANNPQLGTKPLFLHCAVRWDEEDEVGVENYDAPSKGYEDVNICLCDINDYHRRCGDGELFSFDEKVLYYIFSIEELFDLIEYDNGSEFHIVEYFYSEVA